MLYNLQFKVWSERNIAFKLFNNYFYLNHKTWIYVLKVCKLNLINLINLICKFAYDYWQIKLLKKKSTSNILPVSFLCGNTQIALL